MNAVIIDEPTQPDPDAEYVVTGYYGSGGPTGKKMSDLEGCVAFQIRGLWTQVEMDFKVLCERDDIGKVVVV